MTDLVPIRRVLISLSDKAGLDELAAGLVRQVVGPAAVGVDGVEVAQQAPRQQQRGAHADGVEGRRDPDEETADRRQAHREHEAELATAAVGDAAEEQGPTDADELHHQEGRQHRGRLEAELPLPVDRGGVDHRHGGDILQRILQPSAATGDDQIDVTVLARKLGVSDLGLFASPAYLARAGRPRG